MGLRTQMSVVWFQVLLLAQSSQQEDSERICDTDTEDICPSIYKAYECHQYQTNRTVGLGDALRLSSIGRHLGCKWLFTKRDDPRHQCCYGNAIQCEHFVNHTKCNKESSKIIVSWKLTKCSLQVCDINLEDEGIYESFDTVNRTVTIKFDISVGVSNQFCNFKTRQNISKTKSQVFSSLLGAADHQGASLGEYKKIQMHDGKVSYRQLDTEGAQDRYLYYHQDGWRVGKDLGGDDGDLWNPQDTEAPPETGWQYWAGTWLEDNSMRFLPGVVEPCREVWVMAEGEVAREAGIGLGRYLATGRWSEGRPVYGQKRGNHVLSMEEGWVAWYARNPGQQNGGWIHGGRGTNSPGDGNIHGKEKFS